MADSDNDGIAAGLVIYTPDEVLHIGLKWVGFTSHRIERASAATNIYRFRAHFGADPKVVAVIFEEFQTTDYADARVPSGSANIKHFLMALHHLKVYPREVEREALFDISPAYGRDWCWYYIEKVQALKAVKISWPDNLYSDDLWVLTVDGVHCWINEPRHPTWSQDPTYYSHKFNKAGLAYELGVSLTESRLIWMNGPFKAGTSDKKIFKEGGLKQRLEQFGKRGIGDGGYTGFPMLLSTPNAHDSDAVKLFKSRALKRHEKLNGHIKTFASMSGRFRHGVPRFKCCFEAVCVICQYRMEMGSDLYDVYVEHVNM